MIIVQLANLPRFFLTEGSKTVVLAINETGGLCLKKEGEQGSQTYRVENIAWKFIGRIFSYINV